ncbi:MAG: hypothetical protein R2856_20435 [Caldilineaceae bacterium]
MAYFTDNGLAAPTPETVATVERTIGALAGAGCHVEEAQIPGAEQTRDPLRGSSATGSAPGTRRASAPAPHSPKHQCLSSKRPRRSPRRSGAPLGSVTLSAAMHRDKFSATFNRVTGQCHAGAAHRPSGKEQILNFTYTMTHNLTGWPSAVVRAGTSPEGLPIGVHNSPPWRGDTASPGWA